MVKAQVTTCPQDSVGVAGLCIWWVLRERDQCSCRMAEQQALIVKRNVKYSYDRLEWLVHSTLRKKGYKSHNSFNWLLQCLVYPLWPVGNGPSLSTSWKSVSNFAIFTRGQPEVQKVKFWKCSWADALTSFIVCVSNTNVGMKDYQSPKKKKKNVEMLPSLFSGKTKHKNFKNCTLRFSLEAVAVGSSTFDKRSGTPTVFGVHLENH